MGKKCHRWGYNSHGCGQDIGSEFTGHRHFFAELTGICPENPDRKREWKYAKCRRNL
jgi:hypothetical protein